MNFYDTFMTIFEKNGLRDERRKLMKKAKGQVLEIGAGTGVNLKFYDFSRIKHLTVTDQKVSSVLKDHIENHRFRQSIHGENADAMFLPFNSNFFDTVVVTLVFCSVPDVSEGLDEIKRVLKPNGNLIFIEHGLPTEEKLQPIFNSFNPLWKKMASGCHLNREFPLSLENHGFEYKISKRFIKTAFVSGVAKLSKEANDAE